MNDVKIPEGYCLIENSEIIFLNIIKAAMLDALCEDKNPQLVMAITDPRTGKPSKVRMIIFSDEVPMNWMDGIGGTYKKMRDGTLKVESEDNGGS